MLSDILGETRSRVVPVVRDTAVRAESLVDSSPIVATGKSAKASPGSSGNAAPHAAMIALTALGAIVAMRFVFRGAIS